MPVDGRGRMAVEDVLAAGCGPTRRSCTSSGATTRSGPCSRSPRWRPPATSGACWCTSTRPRRWGTSHVDFRALGADLMSISAHKFGGPTGVGALLVRQGLRLPPLLVGGDQERARRAGLENVARHRRVRRRLRGALARRRRGGRRRRATAADRADPRCAWRTMPWVWSVYGDPVDRLPHIVCLGVEGVEPQAVLLGLDRAGIAAHSGSACSSEALEPSPVLEAMGVDAHHSLRLSVGWSTTDADIDRVLVALPAVLADLRALARTE